MATTISCLDQTLRRVTGAPTYVLTDTVKTVTSEHIAGVPMRHPQTAAASCHYGVQITTYVPADPDFKNGSQAAVRIAKADLVPTTANLRGDYASFDELAGEVVRFYEKVNARVHRETGRAPVDMLAEQQARLHAIPKRSTPPRSANGGW